MSNFLEKIPVSPITSFGSPSVPNGSTIGTNFSILQVGGYMEVYSLSGLTYTIPPVTGQIEFTGNTIPIHFTKGSGSVFSPDVLTLNSDNISSGRRKLGMLVYVYETEKIYQYTIDNYETLWNNATGATGPGGPTVVISDFGTTIKNNSPEGIAFINAWTASTIEGVNGFNDTNASWRVLKTGGVSITGGTFNNTTDTLILNNSTGGTVTITGFTDYYTTGFTFNPSNYDLTIQRNDGLPDLLVNLSILASDVTITGGTYNPSNGTATFTNNTGGTFNVTGFLTGFTDIYVTGGTFNNNTKILTLRRSDNVSVDVSGFTDTFVTGATKSGTVATFTNNTGGTFTLTGLTDVFVTGGTYSSSTGITTFRNNTGGTFNVSGYFKPSDDIYVTSGVVTHGPNELNNVLSLNRSDGNVVTIPNLVDIVELKRTEMLEIISEKTVIRGKTYKVNQCDSSLYDNGTNSEKESVYTTVYLMGLENDKISESGIGVFYTPKYSDYSIFVEGGSYFSGDNVIWGGYVWVCKNDGTFNSVDIFNLDVNDWQKILPFNESDKFDDRYYVIRYDDIIYDLNNDRIIYRNEENTNIVSTNIEDIIYWVDDKGFYNPIRVFQWGNVYERNRGIGNQIIINSYNENINYTGSYQINFYFEGGSYLRNNFVEEGSYQRNFYFKDNSYMGNVIINNSSYQTAIELNSFSYFENIYLTGLTSYQDSLILDNNSSQVNISFGVECYQFYLTFNNGSYQDTIDLRNNGKESQQEYFVFNNGSYQSNIVVDSNIQQYFTFDNGYQNSCNNDKGQSYIVIENGSQINGFTDVQDTITIKGYDLDWGSYASIAQSKLFFIHDLPTETPTTLIGKKENRLVEMSLPVDVFVTGGTKSGSNVTFTNNTGGTFSVTGFTDTFVTGGTYNNGTSIFTNNSGGTFSVSGFSKYFVTGSTPSGYTINNGDRWYNTTSGIELVYFDDGSSSQWVQPPNTPGPAGYSNFLTTTGITISSTTLDINYNYYGVNYNGIVNLTLPNPSGYDGRNINIKDEGGYAGTYRIRLIPSIGSIDGNSYVDMNINYISLHIVARNNNWWII